MASRGQSHHGVPLRAGSTGFLNDSNIYQEAALDPILAGLTHLIICLFNSQQLCGVPSLMYEGNYGSENSRDFTQLI